MGYREDLFARNGRRVEPVETPAGATYVRVMTVGQKDEFDFQVRKDGHFRSRLIATCCCSEDGRGIFTNLDLPRIEGLPYTETEPIVMAALRVNGITGDEAEEYRKKSGEPEGAVPAPPGAGAGQDPGGDPLAAGDRADGVADLLRV